MDINRHNYEAYLLDLLEGRLSVEEEQLLQNFLFMNPDCGSELTEVEPWVLEGEKLSFQNSNLLKKELPGPESVLTQHNFDLFSIARMEGDLSEEQNVAHQTMLEGDQQNAQLWEEWKQIRLVPQELSYRGKSQLKQKEGRKGRVIWLSVISAAAAFALVLVLFRPGSELPRQELTEQTPLETNMQQEEYLPDQVISEVMPEEQVEEQNGEQIERLRTAVGELAQNSNSTVMFSVKKDHDRPLEETSKMTVQSDDLQAHPIRIADNYINSSALIAAPVPDQIEPLYLSPASIHLRSLSLAQISQLDLQLMLEEYREEKDITFWTIANAGIKGINKLAGSEISLMASRDEEGEVSGFRLKSKRFSLSRPLGREE